MGEGEERGQRQRENEAGRGADRLRGEIRERTNREIDKQGDSENGH